MKTVIVGAYKMVAYIFSSYLETQTRAVTRNTASFLMFVCLRYRLLPTLKKIKVYVEHR